MKAAGGTKIAERWRPMYKTAMAISEEIPQSAASALAGVVTETIEELSRAEERERVLRDALKKLRLWMVLPFQKHHSDCDGGKRCNCPVPAIDAALATPAPEQPAQPSAENGS